jgi:nucleoside-diphosphate-sugar epimerase
VKTAFITGATGFLGINLTNELINTGEYQVICFHRKNSNVSELKKLPVIFKEGSLLDLDSIRKAMPDEVDVIFHCAANINMWRKRNAEQTKDNVEGTRNIVSVALEKKAKRFIHTSSLAAYGVHRDRVDESTPSNAEHSWINYIRTKYLAEQEVKKGIAQGLSASFINPCHIMGPHDERGWATLIQLALANKLPAVPTGKGSFCHVKEVAKAHIAAITKAKIGENYLLGGADATFQEVIMELAHLSNKDIKIRTVPKWIMNGYAHLVGFASSITGTAPDVTPELVETFYTNTLCDSSKAEHILGYKPFPIKSMISDYLDWFENSRLAEDSPLV